jgi:hypothetical protein
MAGLTRLLPYTEYGNGVVAHLYAGFMSVAAGLALAVAINFTTFNVFVIDFPPKKRHKFVSKMLPTINMLVACMSMSIFSFFIAFSLYPWVAGLVNRENGLGPVLVVGGVWSVATMTVLCCWTTCQASAVLSENPSTVVKEVARADTMTRKYAKETWAAVSAKIGGVGGQITVCCGFVVTNMWEFRTVTIDLALTKCTDSPTRGPSMCGFVYLPDVCTSDAVHTLTHIHTHKLL